MNTEINKPVLGKFLNGRYKIIQVLSTGNVGQTYIAEDSWQSGTPQCVVKCFKPESHNSLQWEICQHRFTSDANALRKLGSHVQIPQFLDTFEDEHGLYLVRELIVGEPLSLLLPVAQSYNKCWSEQDCIALLDQVLAILEVVHCQGMIHGDIKPSNLIRRSCDDKWVLIDFGVAHPIPTTPVKLGVVPIAPAIATATIPTLRDLPAAQVGSQLSPSSDIYALGLIAIQLLTGLDPLQLQVNPNTGEIDWQQQVAVSDSLAWVLNGMVRYDERYRYQEATDVLKVLKSQVIMSEEQALIIEELSEPSDSNSPSSLPNGEDLTLCFHDVGRLPQSSFPQSSDILQNPGVQDANEKRQENSTLHKWEYARELASACLPKLPPVVTGIGAGIATSNALVISFGLYSLLHTAPSNPALDLLERATEQYHAGNFEKALALAKSIPTNSSVYQESVAAVQGWRSEWKEAVAQFQVVELAFQEGRWRDVIQEARKTPDIAYWQNKTETLVEQAIPEVEAESQHLLKQAYQLAAHKDFSGAITLLKQIHPETPTGTKIYPKLQEYTQKQQIKAEHLLQQAYQRASERDFQGAIKYLSQIPEDTPTYEAAQAKMTEYSRKQDFYEEVERQVKLVAKFPQQEMKLSNLPQRSNFSNKSSKVSSRLNPGNSFKEVAPKPVFAKPARR